MRPLNSEQLGLNPPGECVAVPRELLETAASMLEAHSPGSGSVEDYAAQDIRALLAQQGKEVEP